MASKKQIEHKIQNIRHKAREKYKQMKIRDTRERMEELAEELAWNAYWNDKEEK